MRLRVGAETGFTNSTKPLGIQRARRGLEKNACEFEDLALQGRALWVISSKNPFEIVARLRPSDDARQRGSSRRRFSSRRRENRRASRRPQAAMLARASAIRGGALGRSLASFAHGLCRHGAGLTRGERGRGCGKIVRQVNDDENVDSPNRSRSLQFAAYAFDRLDGRGAATNSYYEAQFFRLQARRGPQKRRPRKRPFASLRAGSSRPLLRPQNDGTGFASGSQLRLPLRAPFGCGGAPAPYGLSPGASRDASALLQEPLTSPKCVCTQDAMRAPPDMTSPQKCLTSASHSVAR